MKRINRLLSDLKSLHKLPFILCVGFLGIVVWAFHATAAMAEAPTLHAAHTIHCGEADREHRPAVVTGVAVTPKGDTIIAAADDHSVWLWDAETTALKARLEGHADWVNAASLSSDGVTLATGASDHSICLWDINSQQEVLQLPTSDGAVAAIRFHPNGQQVAVVGFCDKLKIVNTSSGHTAQELICPCVDVRTVVFSADGERMAVAGRNGQIRIWNTNSGVRERDIETDGRRIRALAFSPDGNWLAAAGNGPSIQVFDAKTGQLGVSLPARPAKMYAIVFVGNRQLACGGSDNCIHIWDLDTQAITKKLIDHTGTVAALACDATGTKLISGSFDTTVRVWNLATTAPSTASRESTEPIR